MINETSQCSIICSVKCLIMMLSIKNRLMYESRPMNEKMRLTIKTHSVVVATLRIEWSFLV